MKLYAMPCPHKVFLPSHGGKVYLHNQAMRGGSATLLLQNKLGTSSPYTEEQLDKLDQLKEKASDLKITRSTQKRKTIRL